jgi:hypothetical protein
MKITIEEIYTYRIEDSFLISLDGTIRTSDNGKAAPAA